MGSTISLSQEDEHNLQKAFDAFLSDCCNVSPGVACSLVDLSAAFSLFLLQYNESTIRRTISHKLNQPKGTYIGKEYCIVHDIRVWQRFTSGVIVKLVVAAEGHCVNTHCVGVEVSKWPDVIEKSDRNHTIQLKQPYYARVARDSVLKPDPWF